MSWVTSMSWSDWPDAWAMPSMTPFISATYASRRPKSVVSVTIPATRVRGRRRSPVAIHDEVGHQGQRFALLGGHERLEVGLGGLGEGLGAGARVVHAVVLEHEAADVLDLGGLERAAPQHPPHTLGLGRGHPLERGDEGQRALALTQVGPDGLAQSRLVGGEVERVVGDLEGDADVEPVAGQRFRLGCRQRAQQCADPAAGRHERGGLLRDDPQVVGFGGEPAALELQLIHLGLGHRDRGARQRLHHAAIVVAHEHGERFRIQVVADQHGGVVAPLRVGRGAAAAQRRGVDHVVVDEGGGVEQLDNAGQPDGAGATVVGQPRRQQEQDGAQPLAAGAGDVPAHLLDQGHRRVQLAADLGLDGGGVVAHEGRHPLLEDALERGCGHRTGAYLKTTRSLTWTCAPGATDWISATEKRSRVSITRAVATSSSSSPSTSPVTGCTIGIRSRRRLSTWPGRTPSTAVRSMAMRVVSTYTTRPRLDGSGVGGTVGAPGAGAGAALPFPRGSGAVGGRCASVVVWYGTPCRGLILPPPGGGPYLATTSGGAMIALLPRTRVVSVVGILSSSTQMNSGSLRTSPNRGFLMSSQRVSADFRLMVGSPGVAMPKSWRTVPHADVARSTTSRPARYHHFMRRLP